MDPELRQLDLRVAQLMGLWDVFGKDGKLLPSWSPTTDSQQALRFQEFVENRTDYNKFRPVMSPLDVVREGIRALGKPTGYSRT